MSRCVFSCSAALIRTLWCLSVTVNLFINTYCVFPGEVWSLLAIHRWACDVWRDQCWDAVWIWVSRVDHQEVQTGICEYQFLNHRIGGPGPPSTTRSCSKNISILLHSCSFCKIRCLCPPAGWWESGRPPPELHLVAGSRRPHCQRHWKHPAVCPHRPSAGQQDQRPHHSPLQVRMGLCRECSSWSWQYASMQRICNVYYRSENNSWIRLLSYSQIFTTTEVEFVLRVVLEETPCFLNQQHLSSVRWLF